MSASQKTKRSPPMVRCDWLQLARARVGYGTEDERERERERERGRREGEEGGRKIGRKREKVREN